MPKEPMKASSSDEFWDRAVVEKQARDAKTSEALEVWKTKKDSCEETLKAVKALRSKLEITPVFRGGHAVFRWIKVTASLSRLASLLFDIARCWKKFPGRGVSLEQVSSSSGVGWKAAIHVFRLALRSTGPEEVCMELQLAEEKLSGRKPGEILQGGSDPDNMDGFWQYYLELEAWFRRQYGVRYWEKKEQALRLGVTIPLPTGMPLDPSCLTVVVTRKRVRFEGDGGELLVFSEGNTESGSTLPPGSFELLTELAMKIQDGQGVWASRGKTAGARRKQFDRLNRALESKLNLSRLPFSRDGDVVTTFFRELRSGNQNSW